MGFEDCIIKNIESVKLINPETGEIIMTFPPLEINTTLEEEITIEKEEIEKDMIEIKDVDVKYEKRTLVDKEVKDANGNYATKKIDIPVATIVTFENGNTQVAYCDEHDEFNLEAGISICVTRELMERMYGICGHINAYNKIIRQGVKAYKNRCKFVKKYNKWKDEQKAIAKNKKIKDQKRRQRRAAKKKEREIEILAEAIRRANADSK